MDNKESIIDLESLKAEKELVEEMKKLTKNQQIALLWLLYHIDILDIIDSGKILSQEEIDYWLERVAKEEDLHMQVLVNYKIFKDRKRREEQGTSLDRE